jgi:hypothetical protein
MIGPDPTQVRSTAERAGQPDILRRMSLGLVVALLVQYALGMVVNLYVTVPARDHGGGVLAAIGRAFANGPAALAIHAGLGLLILLGTINLVVRSVLSRRRPLIWLSAVTLLAVLGAASSGATFVNSATNGASLGMAMLTGVALLCLTVILYLTGAPGATPAAVRDTAGQGSTGQDAA